MIYNSLIKTYGKDCDLCCRPRAYSDDGLNHTLPTYVNGRDCPARACSDCFEEVHRRNEHYVVMQDLCKKIREEACGPHHSMGDRFRELDAIVARSPNDIRAAGWAVAVHNDYRQNGTHHTFWLFTKDDRAVKGEGASDLTALNQVRNQIGLPVIK